jgi:hypothetical protein
MRNETRPAGTRHPGRLQSEWPADFSPECPVDIIGICNRVDPDPAQFAERHGADTLVLD